MQSANSILLVRPANFSFNIETASSNAFQNIGNESDRSRNLNALNEFDLLASTLRSKGINVIIFDDTVSPVKPDSVFPNNWMSLHSDGSLILYPMQAPSRRLERRTDIIESLKKSFLIKNILDLSHHENEGKFLEGTGSVVFDHINKIAYASLSSRTDKSLFIKVCRHLTYQPVYFHSYDQNRKEIYHTNVMMCIGESFSVICLDSILDSKERETVFNSLYNTGHEIIEISLEQVKHFAGNMLVVNSNKDFLLLSQSASNILTATQKNALRKYCELLSVPVNTIESIGGGSVRCMMAEVFLESL